MPRFFSVTPIPAHDRFALNTDIAQHVRVLRMREGEHIILFDGTGGEISACLIHIGKREITVETNGHQAVEREFHHQIELFPALIANDRMDWLVQKATELGVTHIQPIYSERSQRIPGDLAKRQQHWRAVAIAACEQCGRNRVPNISQPIDLATALNALPPFSTRVLLDSSEERPARPLPASLSSVDKTIQIFIGPEGGFSTNELSTLRNNCGGVLRLGPSILRAETAALAALAVLQQS